VTIPGHVTIYRYQPEAPEHGDPSCRRAFCNIHRGATDLNEHGFAVSRSLQTRWRNSSASESAQQKMTLARLVL
jgi:hypothetical protein